ncbi:universal stress protein [Rhodobacteraceae bacterium F11138]|nr:universal stress protein [Rhodobacteraceae bacterium F11138]
MSIKNLLVAYNGSESSDAAMRLAALMHKKYDAHVSGLLAHQSAQAKLKQETWIPTDLKAALSAVEAEQHQKIRRAFAERAQGLISPDKLHWLEVFGSADQTIADYSLLFDLVVAGRRDVLIGKERYEIHPERIAARSGRPVLIVPRNYDENKFHEHAVLAWDGNRAAANTLWAVMDILETKPRVTVLTVETRKIGAPLPGVDIVTALSRHDIDARHVRLQPGDNGVAETILNYCTTEQAGVLVMGVTQSNRRFAEELFGGTGKELIENSPIPVLLSQ